MVGKLGIAGLLVLLLSTALVGAVYAEEENPSPQIHVLGEITAVNLEENTFAFTTRQGKIRSPVRILSSQSAQSPGRSSHDSRQFDASGWPRKDEAGARWSDCQL